MLTTIFLLMFFATPQQQVQQQPALQALIDATPEGGRLELQPIDYGGVAHIRKGISIVGGGMDTTIQQLRIQAPGKNVHIAGLVLNGSLDGRCRKLELSDFVTTQRIELSLCELLILNDCGIESVYAPTATVLAWDSGNLAGDSGNDDSSISFMRAARAYYAGCEIQQNQGEAHALGEELACIEQQLYPGDRPTLGLSTTDGAWIYVSHDLTRPVPPVNGEVSGVVCLSEMNKLIRIPGLEGEIPPGQRRVIQLAPLVAFPHGTTLYFQAKLYARDGSTRWTRPVSVRVYHGY